MLLALLRFTMGPSFRALRGPVPAVEVIQVYLASRSIHFRVVVLVASLMPGFHDPVLASLWRASTALRALHTFHSAAPCFTEIALDGASTFCF